MTSNNNHNVNKFFKSERDTSAKIATQFVKPIWQELDDQNEEHSESAKSEDVDEDLDSDSSLDDSSDSGLSGFDSPLSVSMDDLRNKFFICEFEPVVRSSTPVQETIDNSQNSVQEENLCKSSSTNLWEKAMEENPALTEWIQSFNQELELVEKSVLVIKKN